MQYLPAADHIVVVKDGRISAQGGYAELAAAGVDFAQFEAASKGTSLLRSTQAKAQLLAVIIFVPLDQAARLKHNVAQGHRRQHLCTGGPIAHGFGRDLALLRPICPLRSSLGYLGQSHPAGWPTLNPELLAAALRAVDIHSAPGMPNPGSL